MKKHVEFLQAQLLLLVLIALAIFCSVQPYLCILFGGLLMLVFTARSLWEQENRALFVVQIGLSFALVILADSAFAFLIFYECRSDKCKWMKLLLPSLVYGGCELIWQSRQLPQIIFHMLILLMLAGILGIAEWLLVGYLAARDQISRAVVVTAVNEMYEKKLNRELIIKNYLSEKNARLEERENISRNIHNSVGHSITAAIMTLDAAEMLFDTTPDKAREKMNVANERIRTSLTAIRHAVRVLDSESQFISMADFVEELKAVIHSFVMDTTLEVRTDFGEIGEEWNIPREHTEFLTGAMQELLSNGVRHGGATRFHMSLTADSGHILLKVYDNGKSDFSKENEQERIQNGFGLKKLITYAKRCGGRVNFVNENGFGTEIMLPLLEEGKDE